MLAVVWVTLKVVATSTVALLAPMALLLAWLLILTADNSVLLALVKVEPVATVKPPLAVTRPVAVVAPVTAKVPPRAVAPVPTVRVFVPVIEVLPLSETAPVPVDSVPEPV